MSKKPRNELLKTVGKAILLIFFLYLFLVSIELLGASFKMFGGGFAERLIQITANPFVGLFIGILATSIVQSSSCTTSIVVGMVAAGVIPLRGAIPIVMGANIGTTVTNTMVSLAHITRRTEFRRAFAGAIVHDKFNILSVIVLLPLEMGTHYLEYSASFLQKIFSGVGGFKVVSPLKIIVKPVAHSIASGIEGIIPHTFWAALISTVIALALLFLSLSWLVKLMKTVIIGKIERLLHNYLFAKPYRSFLLGILFTCLVQSSSVVTSLTVPLVGAGILSIEQIFPYTIGSNIGTTITAFLASLVTQSPGAITIAFVHLLFNISGATIWYPLKRVPIWLANHTAGLISRRRWMAFLYIVVLFYGIPLVLIYLT
ncbi:hypothetical protein DRQ36_09805 [bacterium]|nr:MAG: hypothetical protein DRQ36_09805 [bacterium]